jgi:hypothetical protein
VRLLSATANRIELRSLPSKTITCGWGRGNVLFSGVDEEANVHLLVDQTTVTHF